MIEVLRLPVLDDNYVWLVHDPDSGETAVVDPAVAEPVLDAASARAWRITQVWNTHWHGDHTDGNAAIKAITNCRVIGPDDPDHPIPQIDEVVPSAGGIRLGAYRVNVVETPGHTKVHVCYHIPEAGLIFTGDTLFAMGCGRLFEGTAAQMFENMRYFAQLPGDTQVFCAHEYTLGNALFARSVEPDNVEIADRLASVEALRSRGEATVPFTIDDERRTNPFLRARDVAELQRRRTAKDNFKA